MISVVVPAYNEELLIRECLESLKLQDFTGNYEIIVADNGSIDNTAQIARNLGARVILCTHKGVSFARQAGAEAADGDIIIQADADTVYPKWWLSRLQKQFDKHPRASAVAGTFIYKNPPWWAGVEYFLRTFWNILAVLVTGRPYIISGANFAFLKKSFTLIGGYHHNIYSSDQFDISSRLSLVGKVVYDRKSYGSTSERSVAKPVQVIVFEFMRNLFRFGSHYFTRSAERIEKRPKKVTSISTGTYIKVVVPVLIFSVICYGYFVPASPVFGKVYYKSLTPSKVIALTFDDGPNEPYTSQILDILETSDVKATFFLIGQNVQLYPDTVQRMVEDGDIVANHTFSHNANHALTFNAYKDIEKAEQAIYQTAGVKPHLYRGPHGKKSPWELEAIKKEGLVDVFWSITTNELSGKSPDFLSDQIVKKAQSGGIILLHDGYGTEHYNKHADKSDTVLMLPAIIQHLQAEGYTFITIPELFNIPAYDQDAG
jgi:peptidoglycan-N-acetylglucosamine deacetylase